MSMSRERVDAFWFQAQQIRFRGPPDGLLHQQINAITTGINPAAKRLRILGCASRRQSEDFFHPGSYAQKQRLNHNGRRSLRRGSGAGRSSIFHGRAWQVVLLIPFEQDSGSICGFALLDADASGLSEDDIATALSLPYMSPAAPGQLWRLGARGEHRVSTGAIKASSSR